MSIIHAPFPSKTAHLQSLSNFHSITKSSARSFPQQSAVSCVGLHISTMPSTTRRKRGKCPNSSACSHGSCTADSEFNVNVLNYTRHNNVQEQSSRNTKKQRQLDKLKHHDDIVTCSSFGPNRYTKFPGYHFCTPCKHWDSRPMENKRLNRKMKAYKCEINHKSYVTPGKKRVVSIKKHYQEQRHTNIQYVRCCFKSKKKVIPKKSSQ